MQPLVNATFGGRDDDGVRYDFEGGWQCRIYVLADDLLRVLFVRNNAPKEPRTWMVAPDGVDVPWAGRDRFDVSQFARPEFTFADHGTEAAIATRQIGLRVTLRPFGLRWTTADGAAFAADRPTQAYQWSEQNGVVRHYMARASGDRFFGLGDKTGPLDKHGRRFRTSRSTRSAIAARRPTRLQALAVPDRAGGRLGRQLRLFYDTLAATTFDLGCEYDNYHDFYRYAEIDDGDLDYYVSSARASATSCASSRS